MMAALVALAAGVAHAQVYGAWAKYRTVMINTTSANGGAGVETTQADFPVLVRLTNQALSTGANALSEALPNGADLRFSNATGDVALAYEIEHWSASGADIWVRVPSVAGNGTTTIRMYWGNSSAVSESNGPAVFDTANGFAAVWHMNGAGAGGQVDEVDATGGGLTATQFSTGGGNPASSDENGVGYFRVLSSSSNTAGQGFTTNNPDRANFTSSQSYKVSAWVNPTSVDHNAYPTIASKHDNLWSLRANSAAVGPWLFFYGPTPWPGATSSTSAVLGQWQHVAGVRDVSDNSLRIYVNGVLAGSNTSAAPGGTQPQNTSVAIGRRSETADRFFNGAISEVRVEGVARTADWIKLEYETQKPGATAVTFGTTVSVQARTLFYPLKHATYLQNVAIENNVPVVQGTASGFTINPTGLPAGLSFNTTTGVISGTPTSIGAAQQYIVTVNLQGGGSGADTLTIAVTAGSPPGAPTNVTAVAAPGQATVSWTAPLSSGSSAITGYTVRAVQDTSKTCAWTSGQLNCTVAGLTNGTAYTFTVVASNGVGPGPVSSPSSPVTPAGRPSAPTNVTVAILLATGATASATVSWMAPASSGGMPVTGTFVFGSPSGACFAAQPNTSCNVINLAYGTEYTFRAAASNSVGIGDTSTASAPFTPTPSSLLPGSFALQAGGAARPFTFVLAPEAVASTEAFTLSVHDVWGRTVWSRTVHPAKDGTRELVWDNRNASGRVVSAGLYIVRVSMLNGGRTVGFIERAITH